MLDDRVGAERAEFLAHTSFQRCVSHGSCSRPFLGCHRMRTCVQCKPRDHGRATRQRMSLRAVAHAGSAFASIQSSSLAPRRRTRLLPINIHGRPLAHKRARFQRTHTCTTDAPLAPSSSDISQRAGRQLSLFRKPKGKSERVAETKKWHAETKKHTGVHPYFFVFSPQAPKIRGIRHRSASVLWRRVFPLRVSLPSH